jgi:hypothetical protein
MSYWDLIDDNHVALRAQSSRHLDFKEGMAGGSQKVAGVMDQGLSESSGQFVPAAYDVDSSRQSSTGHHVVRANDTSDGMVRAAGIIVDHDAEAARTTQGAAVYNLAQKL